jgi:hypothetical protein
LVENRRRLLPIHWSSSILSAQEKRKAGGPKSADLSGGGEEEIIGT